jgi:hypothetical protein
VRWFGELDNKSIRRAIFHGMENPKASVLEQQAPRFWSGRGALHQVLRRQGISQNGHATALEFQSYQK